MDLGQMLHPVCLQHTIFPKSLTVVCFEPHFTLLWGKMTEFNWRYVQYEAKRNALKTYAIS